MKKTPLNRKGKRGKANDIADAKTKKLMMERDGGVCFYLELAGCWGPIDPPPYQNESDAS